MFGPEGRPVDLDRWLELTGSEEEPPLVDNNQVRVLQAELLEVLDDPSASLPPAAVTDMTTADWSALPMAQRLALRWAAVRRLDPRLVPRTMRHTLGRASSPDH